MRALQSNKLNVSYAEVDAPQGHDSFLLEIDDYINVMRAYLKQIANQSKVCSTSEPGGNDE